MDIKTLRKGFSYLSRPLTYTPSGSAAVSVPGVLSRPSPEDLVGGFDESRRKFTALHADLEAAGVTSFGKYDNVTDPDTGRQFNVADVSISYQGETPTYVIAEVIG